MSILCANRAFRRAWIGLARGSAGLWSCQSASGAESDPNRFLRRNRESAWWSVSHGCRPNRGGCDMGRTIRINGIDVPVIEDQLSGQEIKKKVGLPDDRVLVRQERDQNTI